MCETVDGGIAQTERVVILTGAGLSSDPPSNIPAGSPLMDVLIAWLTAADPDLRMRLDGLIQNSSSGPYRGLRFELLVEWLRWAQPALVEWLKTLDDAGRPNVWHHAVARAASRGALVLTTNFDTRIERASRSHGGIVRAILSTRQPRSRQLKRTQLLKLHGTFGSRAQQSPVATLTQVAALGFGYERAPSFRSWLRSHLTGATLLVIGYSGWDSFDVMPLLEACAAEADVVWHRWLPDARLSTRDVSIPVRPKAVHSPLDDFVNRRARAGKATRLIDGSTEDFLMTTLGPHLLNDASIAFAEQEAECGVLDAPEDAGPCALQAVLAEPGNALPVQVADAVVSGILASHGREEEVAALGVRAAVAPLVPNLEPAPLSHAQAVDAAGLKFLVERGKAIDSYRRMSAALNGVDPSQDLSGNELAVTIADDMFFVALHRGTLAEAQQMARTLSRVARDRLSLWGLARAANARAHVALQASLGSRVSDAGREQLRGNAYSAFLRAAELALRLDRLDAFIDAFRLAAWTAPSTDKARMRGDLADWVERSAPTLEAATALYDLACWASIAHDAHATAVYATKLERITASMPPGTAHGMLIVAEFAADATAQPGFASERASRAVAQLEASIGDDDTRNWHNLIERVHQLARAIARA